MGVQVLEDLIDVEIVSLVNKMNKLEFLQSMSCCSGWANSDEKETRSDGVNRKWSRDPYLTFWSLDDTPAFKFLVYLMKNLIVDHNSELFSEASNTYKEFLKTVDLEDDGKQLIHVSLEWRDERILISIHLDATDRTPEFIGKVFKLIENLVDNYKA